MPYRCIYDYTEQSGPFDDEHVLPQGFGRFSPDLVIPHVCGPCNRYFGKELDWFLNRDSGEAVLRSRFQPGLASSAGTLKSSRIKMTVNVPGPWEGARVYVRPNPRTGRLETELIPQVAFRKKGQGKWSWFTVKQLVHASPESLAQYRTGSEIQIVGPSLKSCHHLRRKLAELAIPFQEAGQLDNSITQRGDIDVCIEYTVDRTILRAIGKIAFDYFAYVHGADLALGRSFDPIRKFIRDGTEPPWRAVTPGRHRILAGETDAIRYTNGHVLTLEANPFTGSIIVRVALFNDITYVVRLCRRFSGIWRDFSAGHHFDIDTREVTQLRAISACLLPTPLVITAGIHPRRVSI
jgi:hypothetical protein